MRGMESSGMRREKWREGGAVRREMESNIACGGCAGEGGEGEVVV